MRRSQLCQPYRVLQVWPEQVSNRLQLLVTCYSFTEGARHTLSSCNHTKAAATVACCCLKSDVLCTCAAQVPSSEHCRLLLLTFPQLWHVKELCQDGLWNSLHGAVS